MNDVEPSRAKDLILLGLASQYVTKPVEPETKAAAATNANADQQTADEKAKADAAAKAAADEKAKADAAAKATKAPAKK